MSAAVRFDVLGPMRVHDGGDTSVVSGTLRRKLLAVLLTRANTSVAGDVLVDLLWGDRRDDGARRLHVQVHRLRALLDDAERLTHGPAGYCLRVEPAELDRERFVRLVEEAEQCRTHDPGRATDLLREGLSLWRGNPYEGVDVPELAGEIQRLVELRLVAFESLYDAELRRGRQATVVGELAELVRRHPFRERTHALLMTALSQDGRRADALAAYRHAREVLVSELGLEPGPELRALSQRILDGTPAVPSTPAAPRAAPAQLPHVVCGFVGRAAELSELDELLAGGATAVSTVVGGAGVGKTSLVVHWAHLVKDRFPDGQLYVDLRGYGPDRPVAPAEALAAFLRALGMDGAAIPHDLADRAARFRALVDRRRVLIVLDDARSAAQVRPLLPGTANCFVVVTSRDSLAGLVAGDGVHRIDLTPVVSGISAHRQLPMDITEFTGRDDELRMLMRHAEGADGTSVSVTVIEGMAGVGKTRLAVHAAHELVRRRRFDEIQLWTDLRGFDAELPPVDPATALERFLGLLGLPRQYVPDGLEERAALYRDRLAGRKALILLDNAASASQVRPLLPGDAACVVLVTSRRALTELDGARTIQLSAPNTDDAVALLARIAGPERVDAEPDQAVRIGELCGRLPIALALAARQLRNRPQWTLKQFADRLAAAGDGMHRLPGRDTVRTTFDLSYRGLKPEAAWLFRGLGVHYSDECCVGAAALLAGTTRDQAEDLLDVLVDENLVQEYIPGRYRMHDLIRGYARERAHEELPPVERATAVRRLLAGYLHTAAAARAAVDPHARLVPVDDIDVERSATVTFRTKDEGMAWYVLERSNLVESVQAAADHGHADIAWRFALVLLSFFYLTKQWEDWVSTHRVALDATTKAGDLEGQAHALNGLGVAHSDLHEWDEAISCHERAAELFSTTGNTRDGAWNLNNVGVVYDNLGRFAEALRCYHAALVSFRAVGDRRGEGLALNNLGDVYRQRGDYADATDHLRAALSVQDEAGDHDAKRFTLGSLAHLWQATGDHEQAVAAYHDALLISRDLDDRRRVASLLHRAADSHAAAGNPRAERESLREALSVYTDLGDPTAELIRDRLGDATLGA